MSLESLQANVTEMSDEELLAFVSGTRNNRNTAPVKKTRKKSTSKKKKEVSPELAAKQAELQALLESTGLTIEDLMNDG